MTILPKKKQAKDKTDSENSEHHHSVGHTHSHGHNHNHSHAHGHSHGHFHHSTTNENRHDKGARGRTSATTREEKMPTLDPGGTFDTHDSATNHKRRHRSSPHRTVRKHRGHSATTQAHSPSAGPSHECEDNYAGYNSEDEHTAQPVPENIEELEHWFCKTLKEAKGLTIKKMCEDGACLFRAVADQVYGDQDMHTVVRKHCIDYMAKNADFFSQYVTEDFKKYLNRKRMDSCHGNHIELQALCELYNRPIEVYQYSMDPINTFSSSYKTDNEPIRVSYHRNGHYNSMVDPYKATIGVGLGLPGLQPGLAEKNLMRDAVGQSETIHIEKTMLEDKLRETDWELTQEAMEEQVARESYLQWLREQEKPARRQGSGRSPSATCSTSTESPHTFMENATSTDTRGGRSPRLRSNPGSSQNSPQHPETAELNQGHNSTQFVPTAGCSKSSSSDAEQTLLATVADISVPAGAVGGCGFPETTSIMNHLPPAMFGLSDWEDDGILAQVIAQSQQEYLDTLKKTVTVPTQNAPPSETVTSVSSVSVPCDSIGHNQPS